MADPAKPKKTTYENVKQGIKQLYPLDDAESKTKITNLDVVFVPGLGAEPEESWQGSKPPKFNWASDKNGLVKDYPNACVLLYRYESAFHGSLKVEQFLDNVAVGLLDSLQSQRGEHINRPLIFIGHSMGGLVIAKAIIMMDARRDAYPKMFEATTGCVLFGSPFLGAQAASLAAMFSVVGKRFEKATSSELLNLMKPGNESLRELRGDFLRLVTRLSPKIEVHCFWEEHETDVAKMGADIIKKVAPSILAEPVSGAFFKLFEAAQKPFKIVGRESASFDNAVSNSGLASNHRDLVKFEDSKDSRFQLMRGPLKRILHGAPLIAKNRVNSVRGVDMAGMRNITKALGGGVSIQARRTALEKKFTSSSWLPTEHEFTSWLARANDPYEKISENRPRGDILWVHGAEGRGKTGTTLAALKEIEKTIEGDKHIESCKAPILLVYFLCDSTADFSTAEELLKSLIWQLTQEQPLFASYAKQFIKREGRQVSLSVDNLWQSLQDMLSDCSASSRVYIVINNLHSLSEDTESTRRLMELIHGEVDAMNDATIARTSVRWLITSRKAKPNIDANFRVDGVRLVDLEADKYTDQVQLELRKHAQTKVTKLGTQKNYKKDLAYFVSSLIGSRAQNSGWIDITCGQLAEIPETESALRVRQTLKTLPQKLDDLLDAAWEQIFDLHVKEGDNIRDMLRALVLTYEDPTLEELAILAGSPSDEACLIELRALIDHCSSFLTVRKVDEEKETVHFKNDIAKPHLLRHANKLLGLSLEEMQWQQGELALRSLAHLLERYTLPGDDISIDSSRDTNKGADEEAEGNEDGDIEDNNTAGDNKEEDEIGHDDEDEDEEEIGHDDEDEDEEENESEDDDDDSDGDGESEAEVLEAEALPYMVKHWLHHASKATPDMAEVLSKEEDFWKPDSPIRRRWLAQFRATTDKFNSDDEDKFPTDSWTALHVASSVGYKQLVSALMKNGHEDELNKYEDWNNAPLHLAAFYGRLHIVEELLSRGAQVDEGINNDNETPLSMAATKGNIKVMNLLLNANADINAVSESCGPVINSAILSGNFETVKLLVEKGARLSHESESPLEYVVRHPDLTIFDYLMDIGKNEFQAHDFDAGFISAAYWGNIEVFDKLMDYNHSHDRVQNALEQATGEEEWEIVKRILARYKDLDCNGLFKGIATVAASENLDDLLDQVWQYADGSITQETLNEALYEATDDQEESTVEKLLRFEADPNATGTDYGNALTAAAYDGTVDIAKLLLRAGAKIGEGWALQTAAGEGHIPMVTLLLERGADVNAYTHDPRFPQCTALQAAVESGNQEMVELLLEKGADPDLGGGELVCPVIAASCKAEGEIMQCLVGKGANVNVVGDSNASSPLINTACFLPYSYLQVLLEAGADVNLADPDEDTALICAASEGDHDSVKYLLDNGADIRHVSNLRGTALQAAFEGGDQECLKLLIDHVSVVLSGSKAATHEVDADSEAPDGDGEAEDEDEETEASKHDGDEVDEADE